MTNVVEIILSESAVLEFQSLAWWGIGLMALAVGLLLWIAQCQKVWAWLGLAFLSALAIGATSADAGTNGPPDTWSWTWTGYGSYSGQVGTITYQGAGSQQGEYKYSSVGATPTFVISRNAGGDWNCITAGTFYDLHTENAAGAARTGAGCTAIPGEWRGPGWHYLYMIVDAPVAGPPVYVRVFDGDGDSFTYIQTTDSGGAVWADGRYVEYDDGRWGDLGIAYRKYPPPPVLIPPSGGGSPSVWSNRTSPIAGIAPPVTPAQVGIPAIRTNAGTVYLNSGTNGDMRAVEGYLREIRDNAATNDAVWVLGRAANSNASASLAVALWTGHVLSNLAVQARLDAETARNLAKEEGAKTRGALSNYLTGVTGAAQVAQGPIPTNFLFDYEAMEVEYASSSGSVAAASSTISNTVGYLDGLLSSMLNWEIPVIGSYPVIVIAMDLSGCCIPTGGGGEICLPDFVKSIDMSEWDMVGNIRALILIVSVGYGIITAISMIAGLFMGGGTAS